MRKRWITLITLFALLLSMALGATPAWAADFVSIYDIQYTEESSGDSPYEGQVVTTLGIVTAFFYDGGNRYTFIQDGTGPWSGLLLYQPDGFVNVGDLLEVTGPVSEYFGLTELFRPTVTLISSGNPLPATEVLPSGDVSQEPWESVLVRVENVTVTNDDLDYGEWLVDDGSGGVRVDDMGGYAYSPANGDLLDFVQGPLYYSFGNFKIEPRDDDDIAVYVPPPPVVTIMQIQGSDQFSPYGGQVVETSGVVTLFTANGANFWLQDPAGDGDPVTSDGIFVSGGGYPDAGPRPAVGDAIRIIAKVEEQQFGNALPLTRLRDVALIEVLSSGNPLPAPVLLEDLPDQSILDGIAFWEPLEGMLVAVDNAPVVAPTSPYGEFAMLAKDDAKPGSGFYPQAQQILIHSLGENVVDYNPERILVDDSSLDEAIVVMPGDRVRSLVGAVDYTFGNYKLQPLSYEVKTHNLPNLRASTRSGPMGDTAITTFNVENLFDLALNVPVVVDAIGQVGFDPGSQWGSGLTSTWDNTIRRRPAVCQGDADATGPFDPALEWAGFANNTFDGLGAHTADCAPVSGLIISEYVEGSSLNKAIEIYNGTGAAVNLGAEGYAVDIYFNGNTSPGTTIQLSGTLADGDVYVIADDGADSAILAVADQTSTASFFNGDDAVVLRRGGKDDAGSTPTPEALETQLTKLAMAIEVELMYPEIIVAQEVENTAILQALGDRVNDAAGTDYTAVSFETSDGRGIEVGFLWDANRVTLLDAYQMSGPAVEAAFGPDSPSPGREPLVGVFEIEGCVVTIVGNHFKSKGGDDPLFGVNWPPDRVTEVQRKMQAQVVRDFVSDLLDADPDALVMVTGDLNDFQFGEPGEGADHPLAILAGGLGEVPLINLLNLEKDAETYTYLFDGNSQVLDHMLVSPGLLERYLAVDALHFNAAYPDGLGDDESTPLRASDHDPLEGRFTFQ
jgi:predicted extracellular nuclease